MQTEPQELSDDIYCVGVQIAKYEAGAILI